MKSQKKRARKGKKRGGDADSGDGEDDSGEISGSRKDVSLTGKGAAKDSAREASASSKKRSIFDEDSDDGDDDHFVAENLILKSSKPSKERGGSVKDSSKLSARQRSFDRSDRSINKSGNNSNNNNSIDAEYKKFVEEQKKYFESVDSYCLTVEKDTSVPAPSSENGQKSFVSPIKPNEDDPGSHSSGSFPPSAKKRRRNTQLNLISPIKSGNSSLSKSGRSGDQGTEDENSYDDSFDREIESEFMSQSKSKSRIENSFDSLNVSPVKK